MRFRQAPWSELLNAGHLRRNPVRNAQMMTHCTCNNESDKAGRDWDSLVSLSVRNFLMRLFDRAGFMSPLNMGFILTPILHDSNVSGLVFVSALVIGCHQSGELTDIDLASRWKWATYLPADSQGTVFRESSTRSKRSAPNGDYFALLGWRVDVWGDLDRGGS